MENTQTPAVDLLDFEPELSRATSGQRLANYLIDIAVFYLLVFLFAIAAAIISPTLYSETDSNGGLSGILDRLLFTALYAIYMGIIETIFKGRSIGKLITGTKAVNLDGSNISVTTAFTRGLSRAVPFCAFSALGTPCNPWQDRWSNTIVVDVKKSSF